MTDDYASVPAEMKAVAAQFNKSNLRELTEEEVIENISDLRSGTFYSWAGSGKAWQLNRL